jgi:hypothetical protein
MQAPIAGIDADDYLLPSKEISRMTSLADFPITRRWSAANPTRIQLYSLNTTNGMKA